jgi:hypothetical protein
VAGVIAKLVHPGSELSDAGAGLMPSGQGRRKDMMLKTLLKETGSASLHEYLRHHHK